LLRQGLGRNGWLVAGELTLNSLSSFLLPSAVCCLVMRPSFLLSVVDLLSLLPLNALEIFLHLAEVAFSTARFQGRLGRERNVRQG